jgi:hypothetical protein
MIRLASASAFARASMAGVLALIAVGAHGAEDSRPRCVKLSIPRMAIVERDGGRWIALTDTQRAFAAGVYVLNPNTPAGLPFGDKAALARIPGDGGGVIFFVDGDLACSPMPVPAALIEMLQHIGQGDVVHEGQSN